MARSPCEMVSLPTFRNTADITCAIGIDRAQRVYRLHVRLQGHIPASARIGAGSYLALVPSSGGVINLRCAESATGQHDGTLVATFKVERAQLILMALYEVVRFSLDIGCRLLDEEIADASIQAAWKKAARGVVGL